MKNVHILPTDKPSRLISSGKEFNLLDKATIDKRCKNIYITSDEEIKEGDKIINPTNEIQTCIGLEKGIGTHNICWIKVKETTTLQQILNSQKIILTTDTKLIADGVQAIDDDFLEWFVKNPCEEVEIGNQSILDKADGHFHDFYKIIIPKLVNPNNQEVMFHEEHQEYFHEDFIDGEKVTIWLGKDYIPKEEPKSLIEKMKSLQKQWQIDMDKSLQETKQETLEKAALKYAMETYPKTEMKDYTTKMRLNFSQLVVAFENGYKLGQENSYSQEEVFSILDKVFHMYASSYRKEAGEWFEKFKKK